VGQGCSIVSNWRRFSFHFRWQNASKCLKVTLARQMSGVMGGWDDGVLGGCLMAPALVAVVIS